MRQNFSSFAFCKHYGCLVPKPGLRQVDIRRCSKMFYDYLDFRSLHIFQAGFMTTNYSVEFTFDPGDDWETVLTAVSLQLPGSFAPGSAMASGSGARCHGPKRRNTSGASEAAGGVTLGKVTKVTTGWGDTELNHSGI